jgi:hypothetical protein
MPSCRTLSWLPTHCSSCIQGICNEAVDVIDVEVRCINYGNQEKVGGPCERASSLSSEMLNTEPTTEPEFQKLDMQLSLSHLVLTY